MATPGATRCCAGSGTSSSPLLGTTDEVARVGGDEFAVLVDCRGVDDASRLAVRLERLLEGSGVKLTFGWSAFPQEGENALSLYRAADERLYARRLLRDRRPRELYAVPVESARHF